MRHSRTSTAAIDPARRTIEAMAACGIGEQRIALAHNMPLAKLRETYGKELATGRVRADAAVVDALYKQAVGGNVAAAAFWCKARLGWHDERYARDTGTPAPATEMSNLELARQIALILSQADSASGAAST